MNDLTLLAEIDFKIYNFANYILDKHDSCLGVVNLTESYIFSKNHFTSYFNNSVGSKLDNPFNISIPKIKISKSLKKKSKTIQIYSLKSESSGTYKVILDFLDHEDDYLDTIVVDITLKEYPISPEIYLTYISDKKTYPIVITQKKLQYITKFFKKGFIIEPILIKFNDFSENKKLILVNSWLKNKGLLFINY